MLLNLQAKKKAISLQHQNKRNNNNNLNVGGNTINSATMTMTAIDLVNSIQNGEQDILMNAIVTYNADAFLVEDEETAIEVAGDILSGSIEVLTSKSADWEDAYARLDFSSDNQPEKIYSINSDNGILLVCLSVDYNY